MNYENTPHPDVDAALTLEEAARFVGYTPNGFRSAMSRLNRSGKDLRAPARPGERARRYDPDKLRSWVNNGKPIPDVTPAPKPGANTITGIAVHAGGIWTATLPKIGATAVGRNLRALHQNASAAAAQALGTTADGINIKLEIIPPGDAGQRWTSTVEKKKKGQEMIAAAIEERQGIVADLKKANFTYEDIGMMLGISAPRARQLAAGTD